MRVCVVMEAHFVQTLDGRVWTREGPSYSYEFWIRYLDVFTSVRVVARVARASTPDAAWKRADGDGVSFAQVPEFLGPYEYLLHRREITEAVRRAVLEEDALILRVGSQLAAALAPVLRSGRPFGLEVVGDPYGFFARGVVKHPLRPFFRWLFSRRLRRQCQMACAVSYVTAEFLQTRYPCRRTAFTTWYSSAELKGDAFAESGRTFHGRLDPARVITVASLAQPNKGVDTLIDAVAICAGEGVNLELVVVGDGQWRSKLEEHAARQNVAGLVTFIGALPSGKPIRDLLDRAHLFVLAPKGGDGLPRATIEAMARGLPCLGTTSAGIPELLGREYLVVPGDAAGLARKISNVVKDPAALNRMSTVNLRKAATYSDSILRPRRQAFYGYLRSETLRRTTKRENWK